MNDLSNNPYQEIGERLRRLRNYVGLSQKDFAEMHGFAQARYSHWETGFRRISLDSAYKLREAYDVTLDFIYLGRDAALPANLRNALSHTPSIKQSNKSKETFVS